MRSEAALSNFNRVAAVSASIALWLASANCVAQVPLSGIVQITVGGNHNCALSVGGGVKCWGEGGALGDNTSFSRFTPVDVVGLGTGVIAVSAGTSQTCALTSGGGVKCWGNNGFGQLGDNTNAFRLAPTDVVGLASGVSAISAGGNHTCALTTGGGVKCWGFNFYGQLGDGSKTQSNVPVDVVGLASGVIAVVAGFSHTCAVTNTGGLKCWGENFAGMLGDGTPTDRTVPVDVIAGPMLPPLSGAVAVAPAQSHTCGLLSGGAVKCWGFAGLLGNGMLVTMETPVDVIGLGADVSALAAGNLHSCVVFASGVKCWGDNQYGELGNNSIVFSNVPVDVVGLGTPVTAVAAGAAHACALTTSGGVKCWGYNGAGRLGDNTTIQRLTPVDVLLVPPVSLLAVQSRKTHGTVGTFDLLIDKTPPITGAVTVEPRMIDAVHDIVFQFDGPISVAGNASAINGGGFLIGAVATSPTANEVTVTVSGISDNSRATISLSGVNTAVNASASIGFLVGDVNNSRSVNSSDISGVKARSGQTADATNFKFDVNASGAINSSDISAVKARSGFTLR